MRIWIINHYAAPESGKTGYRHAVLARQLAEAGHDVTIFAASVDYGSLEEQTPSTLGRRADFIDQTIGAVRWRFIKSRVHRSRYDRFVLMRSFGKRVQRSLADLGAPDVVMGSCVHPFAVDAARRIAQRFKAPFVYEIRDIWPESLVDIGGMNRWHPAYMLFRQIERRAFRDAAGVVTLFPGMQPYVEAHGVDADRMCYVPNGIDAAAYPRFPIPAPRERFIFSYFGAHGPANDLSNVLAAASHVQASMGATIAIRFVGDGPSKSALMKQADDMGLRHVSFHPPVDKAELKRLASESDGFIYSHKRMPVIQKYGLSPNKLFEYLAGARPIAYSCSGFNDPVEEARAGVSVEAGMPRQLADAMIRIAQCDPNERQAMGDRGREYAFEHHDLSMLALRLAGFLESVGAGARPRSQWSRAA